MIGNTASLDDHMAQFIGREVFAFGAVVDSDVTSSKLFIDTNSDDLLKDVDITAVDSEEYKVIHGVLFPARFLPVEDKLPIGVTAFLVCLENYFFDGVEGTINEFSDVDTLVCDLNDRAQDMGDIDDCYVIYGYTMEVALTVKPASVDSRVLLKAATLVKGITGK